MTKNRTDENLKSRAFLCPQRARSAWLVVNVFTLFVGIALLAAASNASPADRSGEAPELVIESTRKDFGEVFVGEELDQIFTVRNVGTKPLELGLKTVMGRSSAAGEGQLITASSVGGPGRVSDYLKPASAIKKVAAPT